MLNPVLSRFRPKSMESRARSWPMIPSSGASSSVVRKGKRCTSHVLRRSSGESTLAMHPAFVRDHGLPGPHDSFPERGHRVLSLRFYDAMHGGDKEPPFSRRNGSSLRSLPVRLRIRVKEEKGQGKGREHPHPRGHLPGSPAKDLQDGTGDESRRHDGPVGLPVRSSRSGSLYAILIPAPILPRSEKTCPRRGDDERRKNQEKGYLGIRILGSSVRLPVPVRPVQIVRYRRLAIIFDPSPAYILYRAEMDVVAPPGVLRGADRSRMVPAASRGQVRRGDPQSPDRRLLPRTHDHHPARAETCGRRSPGERRAIPEPGGTLPGNDLYPAGRKTPLL